MRAKILLLSVLVLCPSPLARAGDESRRSVPKHMELHGAATIPMTLDPGKPVISAKINGKGPYPFLLDTAAGTVAINSDLARELTLPVLGETRLGDPADPQAIPAQRVQVDRIELGNAVFTDLEATSWDRSALYRGENAPRGVIGIPLFADCLLTLDYGRNEVQLTQGELPPADGRTVLPFTMEEGIPEIEIRIAGRPFRSHIDSGAMGGVMVNAERGARLPLRGEPTVIGRGRTVNSEFEIRAAELDGDVEIGTQSLHGPWLELGPLPREANLGTRVLRGFILTIDQHNKRVRFVPVPGSAGQPGTSSQPSAERPRLGIMLARQSGPDGETLELRDVVPGSAAERAGLKPGDRLLKLNGKPVAEWGESGMGTLLRTASRVTFSVQRGAQTLEVEVQLGTETPTTQPPTRP